MNFPTIYPKMFKATTTGKIQVWWMERGIMASAGSYKTYSGIYGGKIVSSAWTVCEGKNIGRSNETTPEQQAHAEVLAAYELKRKKGYRDTPEAAEKSDRFQCMLAKKYEDYKDRLFKGVPIFTQPKLDGIRCIATREGLKSREGNPFSAIPHIEEAVALFFELNPSVQVLDGELYNHELKEDFNSIISLVKKSKPTAEDLALSRKMIQYHIYDMIHRSGREAFDVRFANAHTENPAPNFLVMVKTHHVIREEELDVLYGSFLYDGYEGQMIRINAPYDNKRSSNLLKRKEFQDAEYTLIDLLEGQGNGSGYAKRAICRLPNGETFTADVVGTQAVLAELLTNRDKVIGKDVTVVFQNLTPGGVPRFPKLKVVHQDW